MARNTDSLSEFTVQFGVERKQSKATTNSVVILENKRTGKTMDFQIPDEVLGAIVGVLGTAFVALIIDYFQSRRGNKVNFALFDRIVYRVSDPQKGRLEMVYDGTPLKSLHATWIYIENKGNKVIEDFEAELLITAKGDQAFIDASCKDPLGKMGFEIETLDNNDHPDSVVKRIKIKRPFLNPKKKYDKEELEINIYSDAPITVLPKAGGKDWFYRFSKGSWSLGYYQINYFIQVIVGLLAAAGFGFGFLNRLSLEGHALVADTSFDIVLSFALVSFVSNAFTIYVLIERLVERLEARKSSK